MSNFDQYQAHLSGMHIVAARNYPMEEQQPQRKRSRQEQQQAQLPSSCCWNQDVNQIPNLLEGRYGFGAVVLQHDHSNTITDHGRSEDSMNSVVVVGGRIDRDGRDFTTESVMILTISGSLSSISLATAKHEWRRGPSLRELRAKLAVTVCGPFLYACGGWNRETILDDSGRDAGALDTMERILLIDLLQHSNNHQRASWTTLSARLTEPRREHCAVTVSGDRFFLVMGGQNNDYETLSSVDIVDTQMPYSMTTTNTTTTTAGGRSAAVVQAATVIVSVWPGPNMQVPRRAFAAAVLDTKVWVVGGWDNQGDDLNSIEYLRLPLQAMDYDNNDSDDNRSSSSSSLVASLQSSSWQSPNHLTLSTARAWHAIVVLPDHGCLVVAGGQKWDWNAYSSVEVVDVRRGVVWALPPMTVPRHSFSILHIPNHHRLLVLAGYEHGRVQNDVEFLSYVDLLSWHRLKQQLIMMQAEEKQEEQQQVVASITPQYLRTQEVQRLWNTLLYFKLLQKPDSSKNGMPQSNGGGTEQCSIVVHACLSQGDLI